MHMALWGFQATNKDSCNVIFESSSRPEHGQTSRTHNQATESTIVLTQIYVGYRLGFNKE